MSLQRFDSEPRDRRIFVLPEPSPDAPPAEPPASPSRPSEPREPAPARAEVDVLLRNYLEPRVEWVSFETLLQELGVSPKRLQRALSRAWQAGLIERDIPRRKSFGPLVKREYRFRRQ